MAIYWNKKNNLAKKDKNSLQKAVLWQFCGNCFLLRQLLAQYGNKVNKGKQSLFIA